MMDSTRAEIAARGAAGDLNEMVADDMGGIIYRGYICAPVGVRNKDKREDHER